MQGSKISLSPAELSLFCNAEVILTKNRILQKTVALLADVQAQIATEDSLLRLSSSPKISKGENYLGLPYVVLDYPRIASGENLFFIRSMFWWGNFFSSTLQLAGTYKDENELKLAARYDLLASSHYLIGIGEDPWQHHFEPSNYQKISTLSKEAFYTTLQQQLHIKIAASWSLSEWDSAATHLINSWKLLVNLIA
jgi:hypothetical protein